MQMETKAHWENVYRTKSHTGVSWYKPRLNRSLRLVSKIGLRPNDRIIDIGGGSSTLVDDLLDRGFEEISVLDISPAALEVSKQRLGEKAPKVKWIEADITKIKLPPNHYDLWHDRAVFHFLTNRKERQKYIAVLASSLKAGGHLIVAAFNLEGPQKCSGLDVIRYSPETLQKELGGSFSLMSHVDEIHKTPFKNTQNFVYCHFKKKL